MLLRECQTTNRDEFNKILSSVPVSTVLIFDKVQNKQKQEDNVPWLLFESKWCFQMASPCLRFLMALSSHLLREAVLHKTSDGDGDKDKTEQKSTETLVELQSHVLSLASKIFSGAYEVSIQNVIFFKGTFFAANCNRLPTLTTRAALCRSQVLEVLLETCNSIINSSVEDMEFWLQGLERVAKATILGHLLPVLLTANTHPNLRCLGTAMADNFMPQLVQLVVLTSQVRSHLVISRGSELILVYRCISLRVSVLGNTDKKLSELPPPPPTHTHREYFQLRHCLTQTLSE